MKKQKCCSSSSSLVSDQPPRPSSGGAIHYPWLALSHYGDDNCVFFTYNFHKNIIQAQHHHCRIPQWDENTSLHGCFHGWLILLQNQVPDNECVVDVSLWNPVTLKLIQLPRLILEQTLEDNRSSFCLSSPPSCHDSFLLITRDNNKRNMMFCMLNNGRKRWIHVSSSNLIKDVSHTYLLTSGDDDKDNVYLDNNNRDDHKYPLDNGDGDDSDDDSDDGDNDDSIIRVVSCNNNVYAEVKRGWFIKLEIQVSDRNKDEAGIVTIRFLRYGHSPSCSYHAFSTYLIAPAEASSKELFCIVQCSSFSVDNLKELLLFKLDFSAMAWKEMKSAKNRVFFLMGNHLSQFSCPVNESESLGSYIHILGVRGKLCSYRMEDRTLSVSSLPCPDLSYTLWSDYAAVWLMPKRSCSLSEFEEYKCEYDHANEDPKKEEIVVTSVFNSEVHNQEEWEKHTTIKRRLRDIPVHLLELIGEHCVAVEYLKFRATCKCCLLAAPPIKWSSEAALARLQTYTVASPWLMILDKGNSITFIDPKFGDRYSMTRFVESTEYVAICSSGFGWLLLWQQSSSYFFANPFTRDIIKLPKWNHCFPLEAVAFSASPTSLNCLVAGFYCDGNVHITSPGKSEWTPFSVAPTDDHICATFCSQNLYFLYGKEELGIFRTDVSDNRLEILVAEPLKGSCKSCSATFLVEYDNNLLSVVVGEFGEVIDIFKLNHSAREWEKVYSLGKYAIYVCDSVAFSVVAKTPEMENMIYFPRFYDGNSVFYSVDTCKYHTTYKAQNMGEAFDDFLPTQEQINCVWIEPSWSC